MKHLFVSLALLVFLTGCSQVQLASHLTKQTLPQSKSQGTFKVGTPYVIAGKRYYPEESYDLVETGIASWYGPQFHGKQTANGETFDMYELTAAHRTLQMPSLVRVTNLENGRSLIMRINDRGPFKRGRIIDVSKRGAELLGFKTQGTAKVRVEVLREESLKIAQAAKQGIDTNGFEVALNRGERMPVPRQTRVAALDTRAVAATEPASGLSAGAPPVASVQRETLVTPTAATPQGMKRAIPGHTKNGVFYPDPIVTEMPVAKTDIFVQAGSFSVADNAYQLSHRLSALGPTEVYPAIVNGRQFYRVRLGPVRTVDEADSLLARLVESGNDSAMIIVE